MKAPRIPRYDYPIGICWFVFAILVMILIGVAWLFCRGGK